MWPSLSVERRVVHRQTYGGGCRARRSMVGVHLLQDLNSRESRRRPGPLDNVRGLRLNIIEQSKVRIVGGALGRSVKHTLRHYRSVFSDPPWWGWWLGVWTVFYSVSLVGGWAIQCTPSYDGVLCLKTSWTLVFVKLCLHWNTETHYLYPWDGENCIIFLIKQVKKKVNWEDL